MGIKTIENDINNLKNRIGINKDNIETGMGLLEENKKTNQRIDKVEERLKTIEDWESATNFVVNNILKAQKNLIKIAIGFFAYIVLKDLGNTDLITNFINILKKIFL